MKLAYFGSDCGGAVTITAFMLFGLSLLLDFSSSALVLSSQTQFVELNPLIKANNGNQIYVILKHTISAAVIAFCLATILVKYKHAIRNHRILSRVAIIITKAAIITAYAKLWFSFENMLLYYFNSNFAYELQLFLEAKGIVNIATQKSAYGFGVLISMLVSLTLYSATMIALERNNSVSRTSR